MANFFIRRRLGKIGIQVPGRDVAPLLLLGRDDPAGIFAATNSPAKDGERDGGDERGVLRLERVPPPPRPYLMGGPAGNFDTNHPVPI